MKKSSSIQFGKLLREYIGDRSRLMEWERCSSAERIQELASFWNCAPACVTGDTEVKSKIIAPCGRPWL